MGTAAKACLFGAIEIFLLVTPMMIPSVPLWFGILAWTAAAVLASVALVLWLQERTEPESDVSANNDVESQLELVYRPGRPFLEEEYGVNEIGKPPPGYLECLVGVRNTSPRQLEGVRVQVVSASQAIYALPITLQSRDDAELTFPLAPNEMRLVRFLRQEARDGNLFDWPFIAGKAEATVYAPCEVVLAAYARGVSALQTVSLFLAEDGEMRLKPSTFGNPPGIIAPSAYVRGKVTVIAKGDPKLN
jgi:hypothetical protein